MALLLVTGIWILNVVVSIINCFAVAHMFKRRNSSLWEKFMAWCGFIMAGSGFTWCILIVLGLIALATGYLDEEHTQALFDLGYLVIIPGILFTGYVITIDSVIRAARNRSWGSTGVAVYNVGATAYNTVNAFRYVPQAVSGVVKVFTSGSGKNKMNGLVVLLLLVALLSGYLIAGVLVWKVSQGIVETA